MPSVEQLAHRPMQAFLYNVVLLLHHTHTHTQRRGAPRPPPPPAKRTRVAQHDA